MNTCVGDLWATQNEKTSKITHALYMSFRTLLQATLIISILALLPAHTYAQKKGRVYGTVYDKESGETLLGANVLITGTTRGVATDLDGNYNLTGLEPGTYSITATYVSYLPTTITDVEIVDGGEVRLDFQMEMEGIGMEEITVSAEAVKNSDAALLSLQKKAVAFQDAISAESISRSGSGDAAAAMSKVVGASVVGGKYIFVRGLGDRYSSTQLNGLELPTSDPDKKSFQLDLFPSGLLDNIVTLKTFTPDRPGNFSGGLVDVKTKGMPETFFFSISAKQGYNTQANMQDILLGERGSRDWIGFDDGTRSEPTLLRGLEIGDFPNETVARFNQEEAQRLDEISRSFGTTFLPEMQQTGLDQSYSISLGNRHSLGKDIEVGYSTSYSYGMSHTAYTNGRNSRYDLLGQWETAPDLVATLDLNDVKGTQSVDWGFLASGGMIIKQNNRINVSYLRTQSGENTGRYLNGFWEQFNSDDIELRSQVNQYLQRDLNSFQVSGKHTMPDLNGLTIEWNTAMQSNGQEQPDLRYLASQANFVFEGNSLTPIDTLISNPRSQFPRPARFFRELNENRLSGTLDISIPITLQSQTMSVKVGGLYEVTERDFRERRYEYNEGRGYSMTAFSNEADFLNGLGVLEYDDRGRPIIANYVLSATTNRSSYDSEQDIAAVYGMFDMNILPKLKVIGGARLETTFLQTVSMDDTQPVGTIDVTDVLPSLSLIYSLKEDMNLRAAVTRTLARPTFRELAPYISFDFVGDNLFRGSSTLERTLITNYDFRWEWYPNPGEIVAVSAFYKDLSNPLERVVRFDISQSAESIQNVEQGEVLGAEFEVRKSLAPYAGFLKNFQIMANLTLVHSEVDIPEAERLQMAATRIDVPTRRPLAGQSPFIYNVDLSYIESKRGITSTLSLNSFGDRLNRVTVGAAPNIFERGYTSLNFNFNKRFAQNFTYSFSAQNLLDPDITFSQEFKGKEYLFQQFRRGRTFAMGIKYDF